MVACAKMSANAAKISFSDTALKCSCEEIVSSMTVIPDYADWASSTVTREEKRRTLAIRRWRVRPNTGRK